jgi:hypothetical protein
MNHMRAFLPLFFILVSGGHSLWSADAPTAEEWNPVEQALSEDAATAETKLAALIAAYPRWVSGQRTMAEWRMRHGQADEALASAKQALTINPSDAAAAAIVVQALGVLHRPGEAFALADKFIGEKDPNGWVNFRAAEVALEVKDRAKAELHLSLATGRVKSPPAEFAFLDARISAASGDLDRAEVSLNRAVATNPRLWDGWYELGVVQLRQAERKTLVSRHEYLQKSEASFTKVTAVHAKDALSWFGLGRAQLTQAQDSLADHPDDARALAAKAVANLRNAVEIKNDLRDAHMNLGVALLIGDQHEESITHLLKARDLGLVDRTLDFNLMLAYQKAGRSAEFEAEAKKVQAVSPAEKLTAGIGFFRAGSFALAAQLLTSALNDLGEDRERVASTYRYIGHAYAGLAAAEKARPGNDLKFLNEQFDLARDAYKKAGNFKDFSAQHFYLAQETQRSPAAGYEAGWQHLEWHGYTSIDGWSAVLGNYGGAMTGGEGILGMWNRHPFHLIAWSTLAFLPLCIALVSFLRPRREEEVREKSVDRRPISEPIVRSNRTPAPATRPPATRPPVTRTPVPAKTASDDRRAATRPAPAQNPQRTPAPATRSPAVIKPATPVSPKSQLRSADETESNQVQAPAPRAPRAADNQQRPKHVETEPSLRPAKAPEKKAPAAGEFAALERRTPRPEDGKKK